MEQNNEYIAQEKRKPARKKREPKKEQVLKNVVSLRVSDQEKRLLERLTKSTSKNLSDLVREALGFWLAKGRGRATSSAKNTTHTLQLASN